MKELILNGRQKFMGKEIPVVYGGFGEEQKCISDKTVAEIHEMKIFHVRELINNNIRRFKESIDFIDLKQRIGENDTLEMLLNMGYAKQSVTQAEHIYILSERGYAKLIKIMDTDLAWEIHDKLIDEYFQLREEKENGFKELSPMLQTLINLELRQKEQDGKINAISEKVENIKNVVALNPNDWRKDTTALIIKMAKNMGGFEYIKTIREESYKLLDERMGVLLNTRLTNKRKNLALNGVCKSKIDKCNQLDVISDDKKLIEGYVAVVKDMAVKYGAC